MSVAARPRVFIASSTEGLVVARAIQERLFQDADAYLWNDPGMFEVSEITIESLEKALDLFSYAIVVLTPDDLTSRRGSLQAAPRDNLIFELGMFAGRHGRDAVFMVAPYGQEIALPSDLLGIQPAYYKFIELADTRRPDVGPACTSIVRAISAVEGRRRQSQLSSREEARFWDDLAPTVVVVFGVDHQPGRHPGISLRDLGAAQEITSFLVRRDPSRRVLSIPASASGWQKQLPTDADLILVGGPMSNAEFSHLRERFGDLRLKMGRICRIDGQRVLRVQIGRLPPGVDPPPREDPRAIDRFPSEFVSLDFGLIYSARMEVYGHERRVIAIAGIKGNGTLGAAQSLTSASVHRRVLNTLLGEGTAATSSLGIVVAVEVFNDIVDRAEIIEVLADGRSVLKRGAELGEPCELGHPCLGCRFGEDDDASATA